MLADRIRMAGGGSISLTYVDAATSTTSSVTAPGGIASGDLAIYLDFATRRNVAVPATTPSGFTNIISDTGYSGDADDSDSRFMASYKILTGSETTISGMNSDAEYKCLFVYRPSRAISTVSPLSSGSWGQQVTDSNPSSQATTMLGLDAPVVFVGMSYSQDSTGAFSTETPAFDATHTAGTARFGRKLYNAAPQNHTIDMSDLGTQNALYSGYIQVS